MKRNVLTYAKHSLYMALAAAVVGSTPACEEVNDGNGAFDDFLEVKDASGQTVESLSFPEEGDRETLHLTAKGKGWLVIRTTAVPGGDWVEATPEVAPAGNTTALITVRANTTSPTERTATFLFKCGEMGHQVTITQPAAPVAVTGEAGELDFDRATLHGYWAYAGDEVITSDTYGFKYRAYGTTDWHDVAASGSTPSADPPVGYQAGFEATVEGLDPDKNYEYFAYIVSGERGQVDGTIRVLRTDTDPVLVTIAQLRSLYSPPGATITDPMRIQAVVVSDASGGNLPVANALAVVDAANPTAAGNGIVIDLGSDAGVYTVGDVLDVILTDAGLSAVAGFKTLQITDPSRIIKTGTATPAGAVITEAGSLSDYESMLVQVPNTQLLAKFAHAGTYPKWQSAGTMGMEIDGGTATYLLSVKPGAMFAGDAPKTGSGTLTGVVAMDAAGENAIVMPRTANDVASLTGTRFTSSVSMRFTRVELIGSFYAGVSSSAVLRLYYENGDESTISGSDFTIGSSDSQLTPTPDATYPIAEGNGYVEIPVAGTPNAAGSVTFTVSSITGFTVPEPNSVQGTITALAQSDFTITWESPKTTTHHARNAPASPTNPLSVEANSTDVEASDIIGNALWGQGANWNGYYGGAVNTSNSETDAVNCLEFTLTVKAASANISGIYSFFRLADKVSGNPYAFIRYKIGNGSYATCGTLVVNASGNNEYCGAADTPFDLSAVTALQGLPTGTVVTFQIIPVISGGSSFAIYGSSYQGQNIGVLVTGTAMN